MLSIVGHWLYNEIFGWGGIGALIAVAAWVLWFITPAFLLTYKSQLLHIAIAATVFAAAYTYAFTSGYSAGEAECKGRWDAANIRVEKEKAELAKSIADEANRQVKAAQEELQRQSDSYQRQIDDYETRLATRPGGSCELTDDDVRELFNIK